MKTDKDSVKVNVSSDSAGVAMLALLLAVVLFTGEPDMHDKIMDLLDALIFHFYSGGRP